MKKLIIPLVFVSFAFAACSGNEGRQSEHGYGKDTEKNPNTTDTFNVLTTPPDSLKDTMTGPRPGSPVQ